MRVLVCNCGSSSLKFCLCEVAARTSAGDHEAVRVLFNGQASPHGVIMPEMADEARPTEGEPMTQPTQPSAEFPHVPAAPADRLVGLLARFVHIEAASGVLLLLCTAVALGLANSPLAQDVVTFWATPVGVQIGAFALRHPLQHWINDGLMTLFFFVVGLEIKRELVLGELRDLRLAGLPLAAALGGMVVPASLYYALQVGTPGEHGWGIPMATDIAFVVGCLAVLGARVPPGLRIVLLSLAIADDVGAILVIALAYTSHLNLAALGLGGLGTGVIVGLARLGVRNVALYWICGAGLWFTIHASGVHPTIAGVLLGLLTPARSWISAGHLPEIVHRVAVYVQGERWPSDSERHAVLRSAGFAMRETFSPLARLETLLHPWVSFVIMPLFALANAGVPLQLAAFREPIAVAVLVGLGFGKPLGIVLMSRMAVSFGLAKLPEGVSWRVLTAGGILAGIGFTMSLFIAGLALEASALQAAKIGILAASALCAAVGGALLCWLLPTPAARSTPPSARA